MIATQPALSTANFALGYVENRHQLEALWRLDSEAYGDSNLEFDRFLQWWESYDRGLPVVSYEGEIVAAFGLWGIDRDQARKFVGGQIRESELCPLQCKTSTPFWYWSGIVVRKDFRQQLFSPLRRLLRCGVGSWLGSGHVAYKPKAYIYALGMSDEGVNLLQRFDFEQIKEPYETADHFPLFVREFRDYAEGREILKAKLR